MVSCSGVFGWVSPIAGNLSAPTSLPPIDGEREAFRMKKTFVPLQLGLSSMTRSKNLSITKKQYFKTEPILLPHLISLSFCTQWMTPINPKAHVEGLGAILISLLVHYLPSYHHSARLVGSASLKLLNSSKSFMLPTSILNLSPGLWL